MDEYGVQINIKVGETLINVRGANAGEAMTNLDTLAQHAQHVGSQVAVIQQAGNAVGGAVQAQAPSGYQQAPPPQAPQYAPPGQYQQPQYAPPPTQATGQHNPAVNQGQAPPAPGTPTCQHGPMVWKEGVSRQGKPYKGYYCQVPRGQGPQCQAVYVN